MKKIGFWTAFALVVGNILGVGIFTTIGYLTVNVTNPYFILLGWLIGAVFAFTGAKVYGFLAQNMPYRGGDYVYLKKYYHPYFSYLYGWSAFFITFTGSIAALAIGAAHYFNDLFPFLNLSVKIIQMNIFNYPLIISGFNTAGVIFIVIFTFINYLGIKTGGKTQLILTSAIILLMTGFIVFGYFSGADRLIVEKSPLEIPTINAFFAGLAAVLFTYMGWTTIVYIADEIKDAERTIPKALTLGVIVVVVLYLGINYIFLSVFSPADLANEINAASKVAKNLWGTKITSVIAAMILIAILSSLNSTVLSGPRIYQAMSADGYLWKKMNKLHKRYNTPHVSLWLQGVWSIVLLLTGSFNQLLAIVVAAILLFSIMSGIIALIILHKNSLRQSINKMYILISGYIYLMLCSLILINILIRNFFESMIGFLILSISIPFYLIQTSNIKGKGV